MGFDFGEDSGYDFVLTDENTKNAEKVLNELFDNLVPEKIIGINKWSDVIPNFKWKSLEK